MPDSQRVAILLSGRGSNLAAILRHPRLRPTIAGVIASRDNAPGLQIAREAGLPTAINRLRDFPDRTAADAQLLHTLRQWHVHWIALAGWMRILDDQLIHAFPGHIANIHPSLLPRFPGLHPQQQALDAGATSSGCTVHLVIPGPVDGGPILAQASVPILPTDDADTLANRILEQEHQLYPHTLARLLDGHFDHAVSQARNTTHTS